MRDISKNIREVRLRRGMSQEQLAEALHVTRQTISNYETGRSRPDVETLTLLAQALEADVRELLYGPVVSPRRRSAAPAAGGRGPHRRRGPGVGAAGDPVPVRRVPVYPGPPLPAAHRAPGAALRAVRMDGRPGLRGRPGKLPPGGEVAGAAAAGGAGSAGGLCGDPAAFLDLGDRRHLSGVGALQPGDGVCLLLLL